jgi:hypothetical protein
MGVHPVGKENFVSLLHDKPVRSVISLEAVIKGLLKTLTICGNYNFAASKGTGADLLDAEQRAIQRCLPATLYIEIWFLMLIVRWRMGAERRALGCSSYSEMANSKCLRSILLQRGENNEPRREPTTSINFPSTWHPFVRLSSLRTLTHSNAQTDD